MVTIINDPITLDGVRYQTTDGIREDTSSRGVDLAGALIVATYGDGTAENLTWTAFDPYTFGGATGTDIAMSFGFAEHILSTTKLLTSLEVNLKPASSVFDITTTMEDDPDGINTPTSKNGFPFEILSDDEAETGSVTATYSNIVSLTGHPAEGDLFTTILIDFSSLSAGGVLGEIRWNSDIDTLETAGDLVPVSPLVTTNTVVDTNEDFSWATYTDRFEDNVHVLRELTYDNGRLLEVTFEDGIKTQASITDAQDTYNWESYVDTFDLTGSRVSRGVTYDDGRQVDTTYVDGSKTSQVTTDLADVFSWATYTDSFEDNVRVLRELTYDNGRLLEVTFEDGIKTQELATDAQDAYNWQSYVDTFDLTGSRVSRGVTYDDGRQVDTTYVDGSKTSQVTTDLADVFSWATYTDSFEDNVRVLRELTYDNGRLLEVTFEDGIKTQELATDAQDAYNWQSYVDTFDLTGSRVLREITYDDGSEVIISYLDDLSLV